MANNRTFSAPKAYIEIDNIKSGIIRDLSFNEDIGRADVKGLGDLWTLETPAVSCSGRFTIGEFFIDFKQPHLLKMLNRFGGIEGIKNTLSLGEFSFSITIYEKLGTLDVSNKLVTTVVPAGKLIASINQCYLDSQSFQLSNDSIASFNSTGRYLQPVAFSEL